MRTKTKYREIKSENIPVEKELPVEAVTAPEAPAIAVQVEPKQPEPIPAAEALKAQLEALKQSEELQRQHAAQIAQQPVTREQTLDLWKRQGLSEAELRFLSAHPDMIDYPKITSQAAAEAARRSDCWSPCHNADFKARSRLASA